MPPKDFREAIEPHRAAIRIHCYRMLGSSHDGDDVVQETMLRAWRALPSLEDESRLRPWLYRIATNVCFDELKRRPRRLHSADAYPPAADPRPPLPRVDEPVWLEPMPDTWLDGVDESHPEARYELKESVALAFVAALQVLSPVQRATLLLRDVIGLSATETADALETSVEAANSALFRARDAIDKRLERGNRTVDPDVLARYVRAFEDADLDAIVALFHDDIRTTMPPASTWVDGLAANERFYRAMFHALVPGQFRHIPIRANGQPALAFYRPEIPGGPHVLAAIQLFAMREGKLLDVDHFMLSEVYDLFGVPRTFP